MIFSCKLFRWRFIKTLVGIGLIVLAGIVLAFIPMRIDWWILPLVAIGIAVVMVAVNLEFLLFPPVLEIQPEIIKRKDFKFFGMRMNEVSVPYSKMAIVKKEEGLFFSTLIIETTGGDTRMVAKGDPNFPELFRADARKVVELIEQHRSAKDQSSSDPRG